MGQPQLGQSIASGSHGHTRSNISRCVEKGNELVQRLMDLGHQLNADLEPVLMPDTPQQATPKNDESTDQAPFVMEWRSVNERLENVIESYEHMAGRIKL